ncbi:hypothetical protein [Pseudomonas chlororaphis]|uniref:hypothetical protein n=1 Tax=Pseudomonas chlororaphis TaxID=587753 RepID=UPI0012FDC548|nr:hypothetical protein [Pseudomonas chlororaphis]
MFRVAKTLQYMKFFIDQHPLPDMAARGINAGSPYTLNSHSCRVVRAIFHGATIDPAGLGPSKTILLD